MSELSAKKRAQLPAKDFGLPEKARTEAAKKESGNYPMPDKKAHARNAKSRAAQQEHAGNLTKKEHERIVPESRSHPRRLRIVRAARP